MRKKTFKIFVNSFIISLFTMWAINELFAVPTQQKTKEIVIPEKNIALFFQTDAPMAGHSSTPVKAISLAALTPQKKHQDIFIDKNLFTLDDVEGIRISSVEDAADIPLEYSAAAQAVSKESETSPNNANDSEKQEIAKAVRSDFDTIETQKLYTENTIDNEPQKPFISADDDVSVVKNLSAEIVAQPNASVSIVASAETMSPPNDNIIPLEFGTKNTPETNVEIASTAPSNQIAMADGGNIDIESIAVEQKAENDQTTERNWREMAEKETEDSPWVVAKGTRNPRNNHVLEEDFYKGMSESEIAGILTKPETMAAEEDQVQVAEMVKNILIPIPEDILNDKNLTPQLVSPKKNYDKKTSEVEDETSVGTEEKSGGLLKSLASMFSSSDTSNDNSEIIDEEPVASTGKAKKRKGLFSAFGHDKSPAKILPAEMRLSFQPGRAEISGTTLRWIQAFANKVIEDPHVVLEIRIDRTSSFELQQKRLNLLHNILTNKGVNYEKINTVFTSREPNSFIIRTLRINENVNNDMPKNDKRQSLYYQSW